MTTKITIEPVHTVLVEVRGEDEMISEVLEAGSKTRVYIIYGEKTLTVTEMPHAPKRRAA